MFTPPSGLHGGDQSCSVRVPKSPPQRPVLCSWDPSQRVPRLPTLHCPGCLPSGLSHTLRVTSRGDPLLTAEPAVNTGFYNILLNKTAWMSPCLLICLLCGYWCHRSCHSSLPSPASQSLSLKGGLGSDAGGTQPLSATLATTTHQGHT